MNRLVVEKIESDAAFKDLKDAWNELVNSSNADEISLTWEWMYTWWTVFKEGRRLLILVVRDGNQVIGIAPLLSRSIKYYGIISVRRLEPLGTGEDERDEICSDYLDFIVKKGREQEAAEAFAGYLHEISTEWDELYLCDILENSPALKHLLKQMQERKYVASALRKIPCPYIELPATWEDFIRQKNETREQLNRKKRALEKLGTYEYLLLPNNGDFEDAFEKMLELHQSRWTSDGKNGCFASAKFTLFHKKLFSLLLPLGRIKLYFLKIDGKYAACQYCLDYKDKYYDYQKGFDISLPRNLSPGFLLLAHCVQDAIKHGKKRFDFFKGTRGSYKYRWTNTEIFVTTVRIVAKTNIKNRIRSFLDTGKGGIKHLYKNMAHHVQ